MISRSFLCRGPSPDQGFQGSKFSPCASVYLSSQGITFLSPCLLAQHLERSIPAPASCDLPALVNDDGTDSGLPQFPPSVLGITSSPLRPDPALCLASEHVLLTHMARGFDGTRKASPSSVSAGTRAADGQHVANAVCLDVWAMFCYSNYQIYSCYLDMSRFVNMIIIPPQKEKRQVSTTVFLVKIKDL